MKYKEIKELTDSELQDREMVEIDSLLKMRLSHSITPLDNPLQIKETRRTIARMQTEIRNRQLKQQPK